MISKTKTLPLATAGFCKKSFPDQIDSLNNTAIRNGSQSQLRRQRQVERLHALGPQPLLYFLRDLEGGANCASRSIGMKPSRQTSLPPLAALNSRRPFMLLRERGYE